jgi:biotin carboxyl carrier protein
MKYQVTIAGRTVEVDLSGAEARVDGIAVAAEIAAIPGTSVRHLRVGDESHPVVATRDAPGRWVLSLRGARYGAEVLDERSRAILQMVGAAEPPAVKTIKAPMPGLVVRILVEPGQSVAAGEGVLVVEAMKMENELKAPADGIVARLDVVPGQAVEKGAVLAVLE